MTNKKKILCALCKKAIKTQKDLITAQYFVFVKPYHSACYSNRLKSWQTMFISNKPINGTSGNFSTVLSIIIGIVMLVYSLNVLPKTAPLFSSLFVLIILFVIASNAGYRLYSYFVFEKPLAK